MFMTESNRKFLYQAAALTLCIVLLVGIFMLGSTTVAFCADDAGETIQSAVSEVTKKIYSVMRVIVVPLAIVAVGFAAFQFFFGGNQGPEKAKKAIIAAGAGIGIVVFAPVIINTIASAVSGSGSTDKWDDYNPLNPTTP